MEEFNDVSESGRALCTCSGDTRKLNRIEQSLLNGCKEERRIESEKQYMRSCRNLYICYIHLFLKLIKIPKVSIELIVRSLGTEMQSHVSSSSSHTLLMGGVNVRTPH